MSYSTCPIDAMETNEEHEKSLDGAELIDGNQLVEGEADDEDVGLIDGNQVEGEVVGQVVEGEVVGNNDMDGEDNVDGEDVGLGVGQPQQLHSTSPQSTITSVATSQTELGTEPVMEVPETLSNCKSESLSSSKGSIPVMVLLEKYRVCRSISFPISDGRLPLIPMDSRYISLNFVRRPISEGMGPVSELKER